MATTSAYTTQWHNICLNSKPNVSVHKITGHTFSHTPFGVQN